MTIQIINGDARSMTDIIGNSVHLVVTSPPYNVGMGYGTHNDLMTMTEYLSMLEAAWSECDRVLVPGGRIAVNVPFGVFSKPAFPLSAYITLQLERRFFLLNTVIWQKPTQCLRTSWGSWRSPASPFIRDACESIIIAKKDGKFDVPEEALAEETKGKFSPWLDTDFFLNVTRDTWVIPPAVPAYIKVVHPAPFPVELPQRLIRLYAYPGATILDPFAGSGSTGQAAKNLGADAILVDIDPVYCELMRDRLLKQTDLFQEEK